MAIYREDIVDIELNTGSLHRSFVTRTAGEGDTKANIFGIRVFRDGEPVDLTGCDCQGFFMGPDGTNLQIQGSTYTGVSGNKAWVQLHQNCYAVEGQFALAIKLVGGGVTGTMRIVDGMISNTGVTGAVSPTSEIPTTEEIIAAYNTATQAVPALASLVNSIPLQPSGIFINNAQTLAEYPDADEFPLNKIVLVAKAQAESVLHTPFSDEAYTIISAGFSRTTNNPPYGGEIQIAVPMFTTKEAIKYRYNDGEGFSAWKGLDIDFLLSPSGIYINSSTTLAQFPDANVLPVNKIAMVADAQAAEMENAPYGKGFVIVSTGFSKTAGAGYGGEIQIAFPFTRSTAYQDMGVKYRYNYGGTSETWTGWITMGSMVYYATPSNFIEVIDEALRTMNATVYLETGTYYLFDETHNETYWKNKRAVTRYTGINLRNNIRLVGMGKVVFSAEYSGSDDDIKENFSIFCIAQSCRLENLELVGKNISYIVHDDQALINLLPSDMEYNNIKMTHKGSTHSFQYAAPICIGGGALYVKRVIKDCVFSAPERGNPVNYHTATDGDSDIIMNGCVFKNGTIGFNAFGSGGVMTVMISNNLLQADIIGKTAAGVTCYDWNNVIAN